MTQTVAIPTLMVDPGYLWLAPIGTAAPTNTVTAGKFTDAIAASWLPLGATAEGSALNYSSTIEPVSAAEFYDPIAYFTTSRSGNIAFSLLDWTLTNYRRAMNGGVASLVPTGAAGSELTTLESPNPGDETRAMLLWESTDATVRIMLRRVIQGGELTTEFRKAPTAAGIPCTFNMEMPQGASTKPFIMWAAGDKRV